MTRHTATSPVTFALSVAVMSGMLTELPTMWTWLLPSAMAGKLSGLQLGYRCLINGTRFSTIIYALIVLIRLACCEKRASSIRFADRSQGEPLLRMNGSNRWGH